MTVSLVLRGHPKISERTSERIKKIAKELNYIPDPRFRALAAYRFQQSDKPYRETIGVLTDKLTKTHELHYKLFMKRLADYGARMGFNVEYLEISNDPSQQECLAKHLHAKNIHLVVFYPMSINKVQIHFDLSKLSCLCIGQSIKHPTLNRINYHNRHSLTLILDKLRERGYKRIALLIFDSFDKRFNCAYSAQMLWEQVCEREDEHLQTMLLSDEDYGKCFYSDVPDNSHSRKIINRLRRHRIEAVITTKDIIESWWMDNPYWKIPQELGLVALNVDDEAGVISGICRDWDTIAKYTVDWMQTLYNNRERGIPAVSIETQIRCKWHEGKTLR